jgi:hypothetical protein
VKNNDIGKDFEMPSEIERLMETFRVLPPERNISAMRVEVDYQAKLGPIELFKREDEHFFEFATDPLCGEDVSSTGEDWELRSLNAYAVRDQFLSVKNWSEAYDFLSATGKFSPLSGTISWGQFQRWQDFARFALARTQLASAMLQGHHANEEQAEALKALTGCSPSSFFAVQDERAATLEPSWLERKIAAGHGDSLESGIQQEKVRALWSWFRRPEMRSCSIKWVPKREEGLDAIMPKLWTEVSMIEFLLPREALRPVFVIYPDNTLEAIAAAIFADCSNGLEYRTCEFCNELFRVGRQKNKRFCNQEKCKNAAHSRKLRKKRREQIVNS